MVWNVEGIFLVIRPGHGLALRLLSRIHPDVRDDRFILALSRQDRKSLE